MGELTGIYGGFSGEGIKTVLPAEAHAKIVFRLVFGQDPDKVYSMLEKHVATMAPSLARGMQVKVERLNPGAKAYKADRKSIGFELVKEALTELYGVEPYLMRSGGSVNAFADFHEIVNLESLSYGFGAGDSYQHAPNDRMRFSSLYLGQKAYLKLILQSAMIYPN